LLSGKLSDFLVTHEDELLELVKVKTLNVGFVSYRKIYFSHLGDGVSFAVGTCLLTVQSPHCLAHTRTRTLYGAASVQITSTFSYKIPDGHNKLRAAIVE
jgi:hypothetical protein